MHTRCFSTLNVNALGIHTHYHGLYTVCMCNLLDTSIATQCCSRCCNWIARRITRLTRTRKQLLHRIDRLAADAYLVGASTEVRMCDLQRGMECAIWIGKVTDTTSDGEWHKYRGSRNV